MSLLIRIDGINSVSVATIGDFPIFQDGYQVKFEPVGNDELSRLKEENRELKEKLRYIYRTADLK